MEHGEVLIIRSASFQQLDLNLIAITAKFPGCKLSLLTHAHGVPQATQSGVFDSIYVYPHVGSFDRRRPVPELEGKAFSAVVALVSNRSGRGFENVLWFAQRFTAREHVVCNMVSEFNPLTRNLLVGRAVLGGLARCFALVGSAIVGLVLIPVVMSRMKSLESSASVPTSRDKVVKSL